MRTFGKMPVDWLMWTVLGYLEDIESNFHQIIWIKNAEFWYFESFVDIGCLCKVYGISIYINLCCRLFLNPLASCWENWEIFLWKVLWIKSTAISKLSQNDPLPNRLMRIEPEETCEFMIFPLRCNMSFTGGGSMIYQLWKLCFSISFVWWKMPTLFISPSSGRFENNWPTSCVEIACLNHFGLKIILIQRLKHVYQILDIIKVWIIINQPASSKWPFDHPHRGHLTREKVTYNFWTHKTGHMEEPGIHHIIIQYTCLFSCFRVHFWVISLPLDLRNDLLVVDPISDRVTTVDVRSLGINGGKWGFATVLGTSMGRGRLWKGDGKWDCISSTLFSWVEITNQPMLRKWRIIMNDK